MEPSSCGELLCHLGAICVERNGHVECVCNMTCKEHEPLQVVCGSDGRTYNSLCQLRIHACKLQKDITIKTWGSCAEGESKLKSFVWPLLCSISSGKAVVCVQVIGRSTGLVISRLHQWYFPTHIFLLTDGKSSAEKGIFSSRYGLNQSRKTTGQACWSILICTRMMKVVIERK